MTDTPAPHLRPVTRPSPPLIRIDRNSESGPAAFFRDLWDGLLSYDIWLNFSREEIRTRFRGSWLGVAWFGISFFIFVFAIVFYFRALEGYEILYVAFGMAGYMYMVASLGDGCSVFVGAAGWIKATRAPLSIYIYRSIVRSLLPFAIHLLLCAGMIAWVGLVPGPSAFLAALAVVVFIVNAVWIQYFLGLINARFRDLQHLVNAVTRLLFFTTPILWNYNEVEGMRRFVADLNPLTHFVQILRMPLIGDPISGYHWAVVGAITVGGWTMTTLAASIMRRKLSLWI